MQEFVDAFREAVREAVREEVKAAVQEIEKTEPRLLYTTEEAARMLAVPESWLARKARLGEVRVTRMGHYVNFAPEDLEEFRERMKNGGRNDQEN